MKKFFDEWNDIKKHTDNSMCTINIREGEVRWCRFGINIGYEVLGKGDMFRRPVLILKKYSKDVFLGVPLTGKNKKGDWYYTLNHDGEDRSVILNQGRVLDRKRLDHKIYEISETELEKIKHAYCMLILKK